jgi:hypothetical protein
MSIIKRDENQDLASLFRKGALPAGRSRSALALDVSASMGDHLGPGLTKKIDKMRELAAKFPAERKFEFSSAARELQPGEQISDPEGSTAMHVAFNAACAGGCDHIVLITDGEPDSKELALSAAKGLRIDVFYVGPEDNVDAQRFLQKLARGSRGVMPDGRVATGSYGATSLAFTSELESKLRALLPPPPTPVTR